MHPRSRQSNDFPSVFSWGDFEAEKLTPCSPGRDLLQDWNLWAEVLFLEALVTYVNCALNVWWIQLWQQSNFSRISQKLRLGNLDLGSIHLVKVVYCNPFNFWLKVCLNLVRLKGSKTVETVIDFILGGSKITVDIDCSHEIKRLLLLGRKVMTNLNS